MMVKMPSALDPGLQRSAESMICDDCPGTFPMLNCPVSSNTDLHCAVVMSPSQAYHVRVRAAPEGAA